MSSDGFHFAHPWLLLALLIPIAVYIWLRLTTPRHDTDRYAAYADDHLLPYLLGLRSQGGSNPWSPLLFWSLIWTLLTLALAGPRWDYQDMQLYRPGSDLVILFDLSSSMDIKDVSPNRLGRARQELEDLIQLNRGTRMGVIAFASLAHIVSPLTEDGQALRQLLPALSTDLVQLKGSRISEALLRARQMLSGQPKQSSRHLLLISDGDFADTTAEDAVRELAAENIHLHVLAIGTTDGGPVQLPQGGTLRDATGQPVISRLDEAGLKRLASLGNGIYRQANYRNNDSQAILQRVNRDAHAEILTDQKTRVWNEQFFWPLGLALLLLLGRFRRLHSPHETGVKS